MTCVVIKILVAPKAGGGCQVRQYLYPHRHTRFDSDEISHHFFHIVSDVKSVICWLWASRPRMNAALPLKLSWEVCHITSGVSLISVLLSCSQVNCHLRLSKLILIFISFRFSIIDSRNAYSYAEWPVCNSSRIIAHAARYKPSSQITKFTVAIVCGGLVVNWPTRVQCTCLFTSADGRNQCL